jgi:uncharacterized protein YndB with AHSA1/START domain
MNSTADDPAGSTTGGTRRILGSLRAADGKGVVRVEDRFDTDVADLWSALTDPARLARWIGEVEGDLRLGGEIRARFFDGWEGTGRVDTCEAPHHLLLAVRDADADPSDDSDADAEAGTIEVRLTPEGEQTVLVWEERGMPLEHVAAYGAGIQVHVEELAAHVAGRERRAADAGWDQLLPAYQEMAAGLG